MIGRLNYYIGKRAFDEGRSSARFKVDFCEDPSAICRGVEDSDSNAEIRWLMGMLYWTNVQAYNKQGWSYIDRLHEFVDGGMSDLEFLDDVSRIVTRGCHDKSSCGNPVQDSERRAKFNQIIDHFGKAQTGASAGIMTHFPTWNPTTQNTTPIPSKRPTFVPTPKPTIHPTPVPVEPTTPPRPVPTEYPTLRSASGVEVGASSSQPASLLSEEDYKLTADELAQRLNFENNYCASSSAEAMAKCATSLRTCNFGDPPCTQGLACYGDMVCSIIWSDIEFGPVGESSESDTPSSGMGGDQVQTSPDSNSPESDSSFSSAVSCNGMCLRPLSADECRAGGDAIASLPNCLNSAVGDMCENEDGCIVAGDIYYISNCPGGRNVFVRVFSEQCVVMTTGAPSTDPNYLSSKPTVPASSSPKPSSSAPNNYTDTYLDRDNSYPGYNSGVDNEEFSGLAPKDGDPRPGGWWRLPASCSTRLLATTMLSLVSTTIALVFSGT